MKVITASKSKNQRLNNAGASLIEALLVLGVITTLAALAYTIISAALPTSADSKLSRQLAVLNASSTMYRINGGDIPAFATSSQVLAKLQSASIDSEVDQVVGLAGSMVDPLLVGIPTNAEETADESVARVIWSTERNKFLVSHEPVAGIKSFVLKTKDADQIVVAKESRLRGGAVRYAAADDWVWDFDETPITYGSPGYLPDPGVWGGGPGSLPDPTTGVLDSPMFSTPAGTYPIDHYPLQVTLGDPNTPGTSALYYSINNGGQTLYTGETLSVNHSDFISAICEPVDDDWKRSGFTTAYYEVAAIQLEAPFIRASAPQFDYLTDTTVYVTLDNPNDASVSTVEYRIGGGAWESYPDHSIQLAQLLYPGGATVEARALPTTEHYTASNIASRTVDPGVVTDLAPPVIAFSDPAFGPDVDRIDATLSNPNSPGTSDVYYAIADPEAFRDESVNLDFQQYHESTTQITAHQQAHPNGFAIVAYARAKTPAFHDSILAEDEVGSTVTPDLAGGHFDVETSSFIAAFHNGTVDGHVHEYSKKFEVPGVDYFNLHGRSLHDLTDDVPADAKFKVIVANPDLSPGGRLVVNGSYDDADPATWINVQDYADIPLADLPVFSLDGAAGTTQLTALALYFEPTAFENDEIIPTNPEDVRSNVPGKNGEWRNGALTIQAVSVAVDNTDEFTTSTAMSAGGLHGAATTGLFWESTLYWHWDGPSYHDPENPHATPSVPSFPTNAVLIQDTVSRMYAVQVDTATSQGSYTPLSGANSAGQQYNGVGYRSADGMLYGTNPSTGQLLKINPANGDATVVADIGLTQGYAGDINTANGHLYVKRMSESKLYVVDVAAGSIIQQINITPSVGAIGDLAYNAADGKFYSYGDDKKLYAINATTGACTVSAAHASNPSGHAGAAFASGGNVFFALNSGGLYWVDTSDGKATKVADSPSSSRNDGALLAP